MRKFDLCGNISEIFELHVNKDELRAICELLKPGAIDLALSKGGSQRSHRQNAFMWVRHQIFADYMRQTSGYFEPEILKLIFATKDTTHDFIKANLLMKTVPNLKTGTLMFLPGSTASLTKAEASEFQSNYEQLVATEFEFDLPLPEQQQKIQL